MTNQAQIVRVQDRSGRGPWRPGFSEKWVDAWRTSGPPPIYEEIPEFRSIVESAHEAGLHIGCAVRREKLDDWFSPMEMLRLWDFGFEIVDAGFCEILAETPAQVLVGSKLPLKRLPKAVL